MRRGTIDNRSVARSLAGRDIVRRNRLLIAITAFIIFFVISAIGYKIIEDDYTWLDAIYMTSITVSTVGLKEVKGLTVAGQIWTIFVIMCGLVGMWVILSMIASVVVEGRIRSVFGRRQLERKIAELSGHTIVCGFGRMGELVASQISRSDRKVVVVDDNDERTIEAEKDGLLYVLGDAQEEETLQLAGIDRAEAIVACLPTDAANVFLTLTARQMTTGLKILARAQDESAQDKLLKAGADRVVCPQIIGGTRLADILLRPAMVDFVEMNHRGVQLEMDELKLSENSNLNGKTLEELELPRRVGVHVAAIQRSDGTPIYHPSRDTILKEGDTLILIGRKGIAASIGKIQKDDG